MASRRSGRSDLAAGPRARSGRIGGSVTVKLALPRFVIAKRLQSGRVAFYFNVPMYHRNLGCTISNEPLGADYAVACGEDGKGGRAAALNALFDEWHDARRGLPIEARKGPIYGTVDWLWQEYR